MCSSRAGSSWRRREQLPAGVSSEGLSLRTEPLQAEPAWRSFTDKADNSSRMEIILQHQSQGPHWLKTCDVSTTSLSRQSSIFLSKSQDFLCQGCLSSLDVILITAALGGAVDMLGVNSLLLWKLLSSIMTGGSLAASKESWITRRGGVPVAGPAETVSRRCAGLFAVNGAGLS
ncbi:hypothetical protein FQA47_007937 [Oryzias melastigma]|uniref:Uncharacterized protein n=1 Tax=Oryzias melastigma TaxID=30732 RepID=A0A834C1D6_ORYME|nr:hypothetical protein FQA47_007937 [Oryzias melastigma]